MIPNFAYHKGDRPMNLSTYTLSQIFGNEHVEIQCTVMQWSRELLHLYKIQLLHHW